jgi:choline-glycine betaine transporter
VFPLLGDRINGWVGDMVDILSIVVVIAGVCTSLGLGTQQIAIGLYRLDQTLFDPSDQDELESVWVLIIVIVTLVACLSVVSGLNYGIKTVATTAFMLATFIWLMVFSLDDPVYFLDIAVQTLGHYLQYFVELGFATDAFQRQKQHGNFGNEHVDAVHKPNYIYPGAPLDTYGLNSAGEPAEANGGNAKFMQWWTIFYWGWWIAWSPFVGMFIARISKGRTVREVFNYSMTAPLL